MVSKFGGIAVEQETPPGSKFGGAPLEDEQPDTLKVPRPGERSQVDPSILEALFPRLTKQRDEPVGPLRSLAQGQADVWSLPGRTVAAGAAQTIPSGDTFLQSLSRTTKSPESVGVASLLEGMARDPATLPLVLATGGLGAAKAPAANIGRKTLADIAKAGLKSVGRGGAEGAISAGAHQIEKYGETGGIAPMDALKEMALSGAMQPVMDVGGAAMRGLLNAPGGLQRDVMQKSIMPLKTDFKQGFDIDNVIKHKLFLDNEGIAQRANQMIKERAAQVSEALKLAPLTGKTTINTDAILSKAASKFTPGTMYYDEGLAKLAAQRGLVTDAATIPKAVTAVANTIDYLTRGSPDVSIEKAQEIKQAIGALGSWVADETGQNMDANAIETIANEAYHALREEIENAVPVNVHAINQEISELIPIRNAALRRLPVEKRARIIGLNDMLAINSAATGIAGGGGIEGGIPGLVAGAVTRATRSPYLAEAMHYAEPPASFLAAMERMIGDRTGQAARQTIRSNIFGGEPPIQERGVPVEMRAPLQ